MVEEIRWNKYPDTKPTQPPLYKIHLITRMKQNENFPICEYRLWEGDKWAEQDAFTKMVFPDDEFPVVAWADFPKGWNKDEINRLSINYEEKITFQIIAYANKLREIFIDDGVLLDTANGFCAAWLLLKKYFPDLVKRFDEDKK